MVYYCNLYKLIVKGSLMVINKINNIDIINELTVSFHQYAISVIIGRSLPDIRDGLKTVHRRILFAMYKERLFYRKKFSKCAGVVGEVLKKYHPHGDNSVYEALVRMVQPWQMNFPLILGQGNFGSIDGDPPAAYRYTEAKLSLFAEEMLKDICYNTVMFTKNFDYTVFEPQVLPSVIPNLLVNGSDGIAVAMMTKCPPHNLSEIVKAIILIINKEYINGSIVTTEELFKIVPSPDFPTSGCIFDNTNYFNVIKYGVGNVIIRADTYIKRIGCKTYLIIRSIPYQVNKSKLIEKIIKLAHSKSIENILNVRDESDLYTFKLIIEVAKNKVANLVLKQLLKKSDLQINYHIHLLSILNKRPKILPFKVMLKNFINFRINTVNRKHKFLLDNIHKKFQILLGLLIAIENIKSIIGIIQQVKHQKQLEYLLCNTKYESSTLFKYKVLSYFPSNLYTIQIKKIVMGQKFTLEKSQALSILNMKLASIIKLDIKKMLDKAKNLIEKIKYLDKTLSSRYYTLNIIKSNMLKINYLYSKKRNTKVLSINNAVSKYNIKTSITLVYILIVITSDNFIYSYNLNFYKTQHRGGKGKNLAFKVLYNKQIKFSFTSRASDNLLLFSNFGIVYCIDIYKILKLTNNKKGCNIQKLLNIKDGEMIVAAINKLNVEDGVVRKYVITCTKKGRVKKTLFSKYFNIRASGSLGVLIKPDDELVSAKTSDGYCDILISTYKGLSIRFFENEIKTSHRKAYGSKGINIKALDHVCSFDILRVGNSFSLLHITTLGYGKRTNMNDYKKQKKGGKGTMSIKLADKIGRLLCVFQLNYKCNFLIITNTGKIIKISSVNINLYRKYSQGIKIISLESKKVEQAVSCIVLSKSMEVAGFEPASINVKN